MKHITLKSSLLIVTAAKEIAAASEAEARKNNWNVSIAIVDEAGRLLYFQRMDDTTNASVEVAIAQDGQIARTGADLPAK